MSEVVRSGIVRNWTFTCLLVVNAALVFLMVNLVAWVAITVRSKPTTPSLTNGVPFKYKSYNESLAPVYPGMSQDQISQVLVDTRRIAQTYEPYVEHKEAIYHSRYVNILEPGFRLSKDQGQWPPVAGEYTVFLFGGSTTFGYGVPDDQTIASFLQSTLRQAGVPAVCYNFGRAYYVSTQERILFEQLTIQGFTPDLCIFIDGVNDLIRTDGMTPYVENIGKFMSEGDIPPVRRALLELPAVKIVMDALSSESSKAPSGRPRNHAPRTKDRVIEEVAARYAWNKRLIEMLCTDLGISVAFVWQPVPVHKYDQARCVFRGYDYDGIAPYLRSGYQVLDESETRRTWGNNFIWLADMQEGMKKPLYVSGLHYSGEMSQRIAQRLCEEILGRGLIKRPPESLP